MYQISIAVYSMLELSLLRDQPQLLYLSTALGAGGISTEDRRGVIGSGIGRGE